MYYLTLWFKDAKNIAIISGVFMWNEYMYMFEHF